MLDVADVVERLHRQAGADGRVADADRDPLTSRRIGCRAEVAGRCQPDPDADAGARVAAIEDVVVALPAPREAADPVDLAQRLESVPSAGQELVCVGLVAGVPHDPVARRVHDPVQGEGDLDGAERAREMPAGRLDGADHLLAHLGGERLELLIGEVAELRGFANRLEQSQACLSLAEDRPEYKTDAGLRPVSP